ncbi:unnamed protein product [Symbiodinium necroappetens]|uniref:Uncharacterized protein n=1 Tax=Symbiodinium necroappetens TaxID=1628268 RepID=A0A813AXY7_9DINO|nr:unnamed protein product [Symbiodinium necroappetens]
MERLLCAADIRMILTLAALADAHDEHMLIVRLADKEDVDGVMFQEELFRTLLEKQPLLLQRDDGRIKKLGGPDQCTGMVLREVLARMHNWVQLVKDVIKAELPAFEAFASMSSLLRLSNSASSGNDDEPLTTRDLKNAAETMSALLNTNPVA